MNEMTIDELVAELKRGMRVILQVRHAERSKIDPDDPTFGDSIAITPEGIRTSLLFGGKLRAFAENVQFYASPLLRTRMTAAKIAEGMGLSNPEIPTDGKLGNDSFYYDDPAQVLDVFRPENFFNASFEYMETGRQRGFKNLHAATDALEEWLFGHFSKQLFVVVTHDLYIASFLAARKAVEKFSRENWTRFLDSAAILVAPDGSRRYALVRAGLSDGICGVGPKVGKAAETEAKP